ncbi:MAG: hypothetical protein J6O04_05755 [Selenomonadaceae bacterium]|nr:hypothetical protein [Selenomonadaceae bacterium]
MKYYNQEFYDEFKSDTYNAAKAINGISKKDSSVIPVKEINTIGKEFYVLLAVLSVNIRNELMNKLKKYVSDKYIKSINF